MDLLASLRAACPGLSLRTDDTARADAGLDALRPFRGRPELPALRQLPLAVALPADTGEVAALVRWAGDVRVPLVPRGGGSGLMGAAATFTPAVVVDLARLDTVVVDPAGCAVRAGAGATLARVDAALADHRLMLGHDPWTAGVATVGGALGTNGLGYLGARAGNVRAQVRGLEAVLGDGRVIMTRPSPARSVGLDLTHVLIGTEGTLGIVTEATLSVLPRPEERVIQAYGLPSFGAGVSAAVACRRAGVRLACLELDAQDLPPAPGSLLLVFDGLRGEATLHAARAAELVRDAGGESLPADEAARQWENRHAIAERWAASRGFRAGDWLSDTGRGHFDYAHVGVPVDALPAVRAAAHDLIRRHGVELVEEGLWQWPELYSVVVSGPANAAAGVRATIDGVCRAAQDAGGTMEYCHGVGWQLAHLMEREHGVAGLEAIRRVKAALDPHGILNPGKAGL